MADRRLERRIAIVTGAGGGFGAILATALASAGAHVLVVDRDEAGARATADRVRAAGGLATPVIADVLDGAGLERAVDVAQGLGGPHVLINNAGGWTPGDLQYPEAAPDQWSRTLDLDLRAPMAWTQRVLQLDRGDAPRVIVSIASSAALGPSPYGSPEYAVAKAGLIRLTTTLADADERYGTRVLCVVPGWIALERATVAYERLSAAEQDTTPPLVPPAFLAAAVVDAVADPTVASGTVIHALAGEELLHLHPHD